MNRLRRYVRARRVCRALARDPQWREDVERSWTEFYDQLASGEPLDTIDAEELRQLFLGTALGPNGDGSC